eukprot:5127513-Prymnesium_polylepis.1
MFFQPSSLSSVLLNHTLPFVQSIPSPLSRETSSHPMNPHLHSPPHPHPPRLPPRLPHFETFHMPAGREVTRAGAVLRRRAGVVAPSER